MVTIITLTRDDWPPPYAEEYLTDKQTDFLCMPGDSTTQIGGNEKFSE